MRCPGCQHENPPASNFCLDCGARLALACAGCGADLPAGARFCNKCGAPVAAGSPGPARFASPGAYTPRHPEKILTSKSALEDARKLLDPVLERMMEAVHHYEGTVNQVMGDGIMALFGAPLAHEDHAVRACYAALRMQESVRQYAEGIRRDEGVSIQIRVGVNSGDVVVRSIGSDLRMDYTAVGQTTHLADSHRLQGWLTLESASVSYGKATSYLPVIDLLKGYFKIQDRDDLREIREKVTQADHARPRAGADTAGVAGPARRARGRRRVADARPSSAPPAHARRCQAVAAAGSAGAVAPCHLRGPALDRRRDASATRRLGRQPGIGGGGTRFSWRRPSGRWWRRRRWRGSEAGIG